MTIEHLRQEPLEADFFVTILVDARPNMFN